MPIPLLLCRRSSRCCRRRCRRRTGRLGRGASAATPAMNTGIGPCGSPDRWRLPKHSAAARRPLLLPTIAAQSRQTGTAEAAVAWSAQVPRAPVWARRSSYSAAGPVRSTTRLSATCRVARAETAPERAFLPWTTTGVRTWSVHLRGVGARFGSCTEPVSGAARRRGRWTGAPVPLPSAALSSLTRERQRRAACGATGYPGSSSADSLEVGLCGRHAAHPATAGRVVRYLGVGCAAGGWAGSAAPGAPAPAFCPTRRAWRG